MASGKHRGIGTPNTLDTEGLSDRSKSLKHEPTKLSVKAVPVILPRVYPTRRNISCTRCFPDDCGRKALANGLDHKIPCAEGIPFEETIKSDTHKRKAVVEILPRVYPPQRRISATRCFPKDCGRTVPQAQARKKVIPEALTSKANDPIIQYGSMNQQKGEVLPIGFALPARRKIVLGLMASVKLPLRRGKGAQKLM